MRHIGMKVASVDDWAARLRSVGTHFRVEPLDAFGQVRLAFFEDPDGANLEVVQGYVQYNKVWDSSLVAQERAMGTPPAGTVRFDHVAVSTTNLEATIKFYDKAFGFQVLGQLLPRRRPQGLQHHLPEGGRSDPQGLHLCRAHGRLSLGCRRHGYRATPPGDEGKRHPSRHTRRPSRRHQGGGRGRGGSRTALGYAHRPRRHPTQVAVA